MKPTEKEFNKMPKAILGNGNSKMKKTEDHFNVKIFNFSIPAGNDKASGKITCPFANECLKFCYAKKGAYAWSNVQLALTQRYNATKRDDFEEIVIQFLSNKLKRESKQIYVRIHDSGDFYSKAYFEKWISIALMMPKVRFYAYTKSHSFTREYDLPSNMDLIYSFGSKNDELICKDTERHSRIFDSLDELKDNGYVDASKYDLYATKWHSNTHKVGLIIH